MSVQQALGKVVRATAFAAATLIIRVMGFIGARIDDLPRENWLRDA